MTWSSSGLPLTALLHDYHVIWVGHLQDCCRVKPSDLDYILTKSMLPILWWEKDACCITLSSTSIGNNLLEFLGHFLFQLEHLP